MPYYTNGESLDAASVSNNKMFCGGEIYSNAKALYALINQRNYTVTNPTQIWIKGVPVQTDGTIDVESTRYDWHGHPTTTTSTVKPSRGGHSNPLDDYSIKTYNDGNGFHIVSTMTYQEQLDTSVYTYGTPYRQINGMPIFYYQDTDSINAYINTGSIDGALNYDDLVEKFYVKWYVGYSGGDTVYSIASDCPQFADTESEFYGFGTIAFVNIIAKYNYDVGGYTPIETIRTPYGQTYSNTLSGLLKAANLDIVNKIALKILDIANVSSVEFEFFVDFEKDGQTVTSPHGYCRFDHSTLLAHGFYQSITHDEIIFKSGEILDDEDSNVSNAEVSEEESDSIDDTDNNGSTEDGTNIGYNAYALDNSKVMGMLYNLWSPDFISNIKLLNNSPIENIISLKVFPFSLDSISGELFQIQVGNVALQTTAKKLNKSALKITKTWTLTKIKKFNDNLSFLNYSPYSSCELYIPYVGIRNFPIDYIMSSGRMSVKFDYNVDVVTGDCIVEVFLIKQGSIANTINIPLMQEHCNIGIDIPVSAQNLNQVIQSYAMNAVSAGFNIASGNGVGLLGNASNALFTQFHSTTKGSISPKTATLLSNKPYIRFVRPRVVSIGDILNKDDSVKKKRGQYFKLQGGVLNEIHKLGDLEGYTEVEHAQMNVKGALSVEVDELNRQLEKGVILPYKE